MERIQLQTNTPKIIQGASDKLIETPEDKIISGPSEKFNIVRRNMEKLNIFSSFNSNSETDNESWGLIIGSILLVVVIVLFVYYKIILQ